MSTILDTQAESDFSKARSKALINEIQHFLNPEESQLLSFTDVKKMLKPSGEVYQGMQVVPVKLIAGSEGRYKDFDNHFFPKSIHLKKRWTSIDKAHLSDVILPPIVLYELGGLYFVRDGNHRVSVARAQGVENIDAEVISLQSEIRLKPNMTVSQMMQQVIHYEKRVFYSETSFGDITDCWNLDFTATGQYDVIYNHIIIHKYYINQKIDHEISFEEAAKSWYENVYSPIVQEIRAEHLLAAFPGQSEGDMYMWLVRRWDDYKRKDGSISAAEAVRKAGKERGKDIFHRLERYLAYYFKKLSKS